MKEDGRWARPLAWMKERSPPIHHFLTRDDKPFPMVREGLAIVTFLAILAGVLWGLTGQPLGESPVVVVESGSMMHCDPEFVNLGRDCQRPDEVSYGRIGTIDPGDLIFVKDVDGNGDVQAWAQAVGKCDNFAVDSYLDCLCAGRESHGACGDVIIYQKSDTRDPTPVIHRALVFLEIHGGGLYSIDLPESYGCTDLVRVQLSGLRSACLARLGIDNLETLHYLDSLAPEDSGFITRGDNNNDYDQNNANIEPLPVPADRIIGKARGEVPWLGLVKLFVSDLGGGSNNFANASGDAKVMMWVSLGLIVGGPAAFERVQHMRKQRNEPKE